jgi:uncharacterized protein YndB with AHSA1/START domain
MHGPNGMKFPNRGKYIEVEPIDRLVYEHGEDVDNDPMRFDVTVRFVAHGGTTELIMRSVFPTAVQRDLVVNKYGAIEGGKQTLARLEEFLNRREITRPNKPVAP